MNEPIDKITFEVIRHRLTMVAEEMGIALAQVSSSPVVTEVKDFCTAIFDHAGHLVAMGAYVIGHVGAMQFALRNLLSSAHPGEFDDGDMFIMNDPYLGALHQSDIVILSPVFYEGDPIAWAGCMAHHEDVGSLRPGGASPDATELYHEGLRLPPLKIVRLGKLDVRLMEMLKAMVRTPGQLEMDLFGQISANHTARRRIREIARTFGAVVLRLAMEGIIRATEAKIRDRIARLPDGEWSCQDHADNIGSSNAPICLRLTMTKQGETLTFDFSGSSEQVPGFVNCTFPGTWGGVFTAVVPMLAYDIVPWNHGLSECIRVLAPEGTICNAKPPAPVGGASTRGMWMVANAASRCLSGLLGSTEATKEEATATWYGSNQTVILSGRNGEGRPFTTRLMDTVGGGGGGRDGLDGVDAGGNRNSPSLRMANVELLESRFPVLFLFRRTAQDSGGAGRYRGGLALETAFMPWGVDEIFLTVAGVGTEMSNSLGLDGGLPGAPGAFRVLRSSKPPALLVQEQRSEDDHLWEKLPANVPLLDLGQGEAFRFRNLGGGGFGDPLERDPAAVARDVRNGHVSPQTAERVYGVIAGRDTGIDYLETEATRLRQRRLRLGGEAVLDHVTPASCSACHAAEPWLLTHLRAACLRKMVRPNAVGPLFPEESRFAYEFLYCPACARIVDIELRLES